MRDEKIGPVDAGVCEKINGNQIQDGGLAVILSGRTDHRKEPSSSHPTMSHQKIGPVNPGVGQKIDRNRKLF
jgi:hypothetical protein